jgi:L-lactate dehydrogenase complex protein LldF
MQQSEAFSQRIGKALLNTQARQNLRTTMDRLKLKRRQQFPDRQQLEDLRSRATAIRQNALKRLPELLEKLEAKLTANGIQVHWAETPEQANNTIYNILDTAGARSVVKGKSMVSEEIDMNAFLQQRGIDVLESDLGEFIIQLAHEPPSHIIMPAIHKNARDVARLFHRHFPQLGYTEDVEELTLQARQILRNRFTNADAGISGVNFAVAETGTLCLVENEGNGRLSTTAPDLHIAITGIEKVIEKLEDLPPLLDILPKTATGQPITTYVNMISGPRRDNEKDGPKAVHLVLLDNSRTDIHNSQDFVDTLRCIRCGTCINHCPVYVQVGGHAYGSTYPGPIGTVLEPQRIGLDKIGALTSACSLCGACAEACPVKIPLPELINQLRFESVNSGPAKNSLKGRGSLRKSSEYIGWKLWKFIYSQPVIYRLFSLAATRLHFLTPSRLGRWTKYRTVPVPASKTLHELAKLEGFSNEQ